VGFYPEGIAIDQQGNVWIANYGSNNVTKLSSTGVTIGTYPVGKAPEGIAIDQQGNVWVANDSDGTITELDSTGKIVGTYSAGASPEGIAIDESGNVWVTNWINPGIVSELAGATTGPQYFPVTGPQFAGGGNE
jgi:streptogramin lyase